MQAPPIMPIDVTGVIAVFMGTLIVLIPVAGVTVRFALKPIAEAIARIRASQSASQEMSLMAQRLDLLERQLSGVESELHRLREVQEFHAQLKAPER
jgi:hypothetical protein